MATYYVRSGAGGAGTGADWTNAFTTMVAALSGKAAGDVFYVAADHAETQASAMTLTFQGTEASPQYVYCVTHTGTVPPVSADLRTTGSITTTGANAMTIQGGSFYIYGLTFNSGSGAGGSAFTIGANARSHRFDSCTLALPQTGSPLFLFTGTACRIILKNTTLSYASLTANTILRVAYMSWDNVTLSGTAPTTLFTDNGTGGQLVVTASDLSLLGSGKTLIGSLGNSGSYPWRFIGCKLGSSVTVATTPPTNGAIGTDLINCDSGATNYRTERYRYAGTQTVETTIVRTGGATDGTTPIAWKLITTANSEWVMPFESMPMAIWNDTSGASKTVTVYGVWGGGAVPNNDEIWIEVQYPGDASYPKGSVISSTKADGLAAGSAVTSDGSTWGGSTTAFKMAVTFTPQMKGPFNIVVKAAKVSSTFYIDPKPVVT
jgi:hypothetical protein